MAFGVGGFAPDAEQQIVRGVADATYDLGVVGTRVFDTLGVSNFQALDAPMLIDSYAAEAAVIESDIPAQMLRSLDRLQVSGLGLIADGLRKPIAVEKPLLSPKDWAGIGFGAYRSQTLHRRSGRSARSRRRSSVLTVTGPLNVTRSRVSR